MTTINEYDVRFPNWALSYIVNDDPSGLLAGEVKLVDKFMAPFYQEAKAIGGHLIFDCGEEIGFCRLPDFGKACDCHEAKILIMKG